MRYKFALLALVSLILSSAASMAVAQQEWELRRDRDGIQVYTRSVEGSPHKAVRTVTVLHAVNLASLVALIEDAAACPDWADRCAESYLHERLSETESLVYTHNDMPFPVKDRDVLARVRWVQNPDTFEVAMTSSATEGILDKVRGRLRLTKAEAKWNFAPQADGSVLISNEVHLDPGSSLPGWVTNMLLVDAPFETMASFISEVREPKYSEAELSFIQEPPK